MTPKNNTWKRVIFVMDCDKDGNCPACKNEFAECECPGPTMDGYEYEEFEDGLYARKVTYV